jgi:hypothetical protein
LIVERDSQIILILFSKMINRADMENISPCSQLTTRLIVIAALIRLHLVLIPLHVLWRANEIAENLSNIRVALDGPDLICTFPTHNDHPILQDFISRALIIDIPLDKVSTGSTCPWEKTVPSMAPQTT